MNNLIKTYRVYLLKGVFGLGLIILISLPSIGQELSSVGKAKPITVTGGVSVNTIGYSAFGIDDRRDPFNYFASGNLNLNLYGWSVPLSFTFSNQNTSFQQPFNQYGMHPTYKWVTAHIGYVGMTFSPYTLNGHQFLGVGADFQPTEKLKISAMYGRLLKAVLPDSTNDSNIPTFARMGYGFKASYGSASDNIGLVMFRASDDVTSLGNLPDSLELLPEDNVVISLDGSKMIVKDLIFSAEWATSAVSRNKLSGLYDSENRNILSYFHTQRLTTSYFNAYKMALSYKIGAYAVGAGYERIDPGYRTLGAYYFNNDLENITVNAATSIFKGKVTLSTNVGIQRDNLDDAKVSAMNRFTGSGNIGYSPSNRLNMSANYSNFRTFTNIRSQFTDLNQLTPYDNIDTLNYTQISQSTNMNANYVLSTSESRRQNLSFNASYQQASDEQGGVEQSSGSQFYMLNSAYSMNNVPRNMSITVAFNYNNNKAGDLNSTTTGPTIAINRTFMDKKLRSSASISMNNAYTGSLLTNRVLNGRLSGSYSVEKKHNFTLSLVVINRETLREGTTEAFTELTGTFGYSYRF